MNYVKVRRYARRSWSLAGKRGAVAQFPDVTRSSPRYATAHTLTAAAAKATTHRQCCHALLEAFWQAGKFLLKESE